MKEPPRRLGSPRRGISEVLGALLLIIVVVTAVAALAFFLSTAEAQALNRQAYLTSVADEKFDIPFAQFSPASPAFLWELDGASARYYVQYVDPTDVLLTQQGPKHAAFPAVLAGGSFNAIAKGVSASISFGSPNIVALGGAGFAFGPATWSNITLTVRNLNTASSNLFQVQANGVWMTSWYEVDQSGNVLDKFGPAIAPLTVPARGAVNVLLNFSALTRQFDKNDSFAVTLLTTAGNLFQSTFSSPVSVARESTTSESLQVATRDVPTFDGSKSFSGSSDIRHYVWKLDIPLVSAGCSDSSFSTPASLDTKFVSGLSYQYLPESLFSNSELSPGASQVCVTGPIRATLTVTDGNGLLSTSNSIVVAKDSNVAPVSALGVTPGWPMENLGNKTGMVRIQVHDLFGRMVPGTVLTLLKISGDLTGILPAITSNSTGVAYFHVYWASGGAVEVTLGGLPPVELSFP